MSRHHRRTNITALLEEHAEDYHRNTNDYHIDELSLRKLAEGIHGLYTPKTRYKMPGIIGWFDTSQQYNELVDTDSVNIVRSTNRREYYHPPATLFIGPYEDWREYFDGPIESQSNSFIRSNFGALDNVYTVQPDFAPASGEERDPSDVHNQQVGLNDFTDPTPCDYSDVRSCSCCQCPTCGSIAIRERKSADPAEKYACGNPSQDCSAFERPTVKPARRGD